MILFEIKNMVNSRENLKIHSFGEKFCIKIRISVFWPCIKIELSRLKNFFGETETGLCSEIYET